MADLTWTEEQKLVKLLQMEGGYVLNFSNSTFSRFFNEHRINIDAERYFRDGGSKGRRMRAFLKLDANHTVGRVINSLLEYAEERELFTDIKNASALIEDCRAIAERLLERQPVDEINALLEGGDGRDIETVVEHMRHAIDNNQPEAALDRLHTYLVKYIRALCEKHGVHVKSDSALHAIFGAYARSLREAGHIESRMTTAILRETGRILEPFNDVRNNRSFAHDNELLNYEESMLVLNHVAATVRFLNSLEAKLQEKAADAKKVEEPELPF